MIVNKFDNRLRAREDVCIGVASLANMFLYIMGNAFSMYLFLGGFLYKKINSLNLVIFTNI